MDKETIANKKASLEAEFKRVNENRQKAQEIVNQCAQNLIRLQGAYAQLEELEKEFDEKSKESLEKTD